MCVFVAPAFDGFSVVVVVVLIFAGVVVDSVLVSVWYYLSFCRPSIFIAGKLHFFSASKSIVAGGGGGSGVLNVSSPVHSIALHTL